MPVPAFLRPSFSATVYLPLDTSTVVLSDALALPLVLPVALSEPGFFSTASDPVPLALAPALFFALASTGPVAWLAIG
jgi:hypothetical protein